MSEFDLIEIGTSGDDDILILLALDGKDDAAIEGVADDVFEDLTFGVDAGVATGVGVLLGLIEVELLIFGMDGISEKFEFDVFILLS